MKYDLDKPQTKDNRKDNLKTWSEASGLKHTFLKRFRSWYKSKKKFTGMDEKHKQIVRDVNSEIVALGGKRITFKELEEIVEAEGLDKILKERLED